MYIFGSQPPSHKHKKFILSFRVFKRILLLIGKLAIHLGGKEIPTLLIIYTKLLLDEKKSNEKPELFITIGGSRKKLYI